MWYFLTAVIFFAAGAGVAWYYRGERMKELEKATKAARKTIQRGLDAVRSVHQLAWGAEKHPETLEQVYNELWQWGGLEEKGTPN